MTINHKLRANLPDLSSHKGQLGFTLIELMIAITISLLIMLALVTVFVNISRSNAEMAKTNIQIENGRFAIQLLQNDIVHAGFWGAHTPHFDDLLATEAPEGNDVPGGVNAAGVPGSLPTSVPDPCREHATDPWDYEYKANLIGIPVQGYDAAPTGCTGVVTNKKSDTDVIVVRHADTCTPGTANCDVLNSNKFYFQASLCFAVAQAGGANTITLASSASADNEAYTGKVIRIVAGAAKGQSRTITGYVGATKVATVADWEVGNLPNETSNYTMDALSYVFDEYGTGATHTATNRNCSTIADLRKFVSHIYYVRTLSAPNDPTPTLMRSQFDWTAADGLKHTDAIPLVEGIEGFRVEYGIDTVSDSGINIITDTNASNRFTAPIKWADPDLMDSPTNRGDGIPDQYVRCTAAAPCTVDQMRNVVTVKLYVLARSKDITPGYLDNKTYNLGTTTMGPFNDKYKRHLFSTTVRLNNVSGRRETP